MEPTNSYIRQKRILTIFSGLLLVSIFVGIEAPDGGHSLLPFKLKDPSSIPHILAAIVIYNFVQHILNWRLQIESARREKNIYTDFVITNVVSLSSLVVYLGNQIPQKVYEEVGSLIARYTPVWPEWLDIVFQIFGVFAASALLAIRVSEFAQKLASSRQKKNTEKSENILALLNQSGWVLHFNSKSAHARKQISFMPDGNIGLGKNKNESSWRLTGEFLELLNSEGKVFSRFKYDPSSNRFLHTNDEDTLSLRNQIIYIDANFKDRV
ncbi:MAG: hypothetical protein ACK4FK_12585 [Ferrovibrio sp.]|uniref:hypothetical protein n=1 Tax=Ferrovibrio sp. TaxID=1917215 RepID=UPI00391CA7A8